MRKLSIAALSAVLLASSFPTSAFADARPSSTMQQAAPGAASNQGQVVQKPVNPTADGANAPSAPRAVTSADREKYAAREAASPDSKKYKGGDEVVVIGASTLALVLGIILLVVLLK
jgi:hypothetical protein